MGSSKKTTTNNVLHIDSKKKDPEHLALPKSNCCGCAVCSFVCPAKAISMIKDSEGFLYPVVNENKCVHCNRCVESCAFSNEKGKTEYNNYKDYPKVYAVKHVDNAIRMASRSGGAFTALTDSVLDMGGVVYGCILDENFHAIHIRAVNKKDRDLMRGSKYVQSDLKDTFSLVKQDIANGKKVLFSGTPCQIAALRNFLKNNYDLLYCIDIVCHGVPSPRVWNDYLRWRENEYGQCKHASFRDKEHYGWDSHVETLAFGNKSYSFKDYATLFHQKNILRPSCFTCPYRSLIRAGDISLADFWMIDKILPSFNDNKGVSQVFVNNMKGENLLEMSLSRLCCVQTDVNASIKPSVLRQLQKPRFRSFFWKVYNRHDFGYILKWYGENGIITRIERKRIKIKKHVSALKKKIKEIM